MKSMKESFKFLIKEFHESELPITIERDLAIPETRKIITLAGSRRAGKTFYFYQIMKSIPKDRILYINFEDDRIMPLEYTQLDAILEAYYEMYPENKDKQIFLFFDEIQNIKSWELYIRRIYDKENIRLFITGSNSKMLSKEIATSLRGRTLTFNMFPLSFREFLRFNGVQATKHASYSKDRFHVKSLFEKYLDMGGFPEVVLEKNHLEHRILDSYFEIMIYRDIVDRFLVRNTSLLKTLSKYLLTNISSQFSMNSYYNSLKEITSVGKETIFEYAHYLEEANMVFFVPLFSYSLKKQQANPKKAYCIDNGLRNAVSFKFSKDQGKLAKNLAFIELKRKEKEVYYWQDKYEVDFIIKEKDNSLEAINVCYSDDIGEREIKGLIDFKEQFASKLKRLILLTKDTEKQENGITFIPLWKWLLLD